MCQILRNVLFVFGVFFMFFKVKSFYKYDELLIPIHNKFINVNYNSNAQMIWPNVSCWLDHMTLLVTLFDFDFGALFYIKNIEAGLSKYLISFKYILRNNNKLLYQATKGLLFKKSILLKWSLFYFIMISGQLYHPVISYFTLLIL